MSAQRFGSPDGIQTQFRLTDVNGAPLSKSAIVTAINAIYRTDWQGRQLLYSTARTNFVQENDNLAAWFSYVTGTGAASVVEMTDPVVGTFWRITKTAGAPGDRAGLLMNLTGLSGSGYTTDCYVRASSATTAFVAPYCDAQKVGGGLSTQGAILEGAQYAGSGFTRLLASPRTNDALAGGASYYIWVQSDVGDYIDVKFPSLWEGWMLTAVQIGASFATGANATTVTDYTNNGDGTVSLAQAPLPLAVLDWDGSYTLRQVLQGGFLESGDDLATSVYISLFTDRLADASDAIPDGSNDRRGWWGDLDQAVPIGSRLWLLDRSKLTPDVAKRAKDYINESLKWMIDDKVVAAVTVTTTIVAPNMLSVLIVLQQSSGATRAIAFQWAWNQLH